MTLMRANQKNYYALRKKSDKSPEDFVECKKYLDNAVMFERQIDAEIERVQAILNAKK